MGRLVQGGVHSYGDFSGASTPDMDAVYDPVRVFSTGSSPRQTLTRIYTRCPQNVIDWDQYTIVGKNTKLEKPYLRLTSVSGSLRCKRPPQAACAPVATLPGQQD